MTSSGMVSKYCLIKKMPVGVAAGGMISAHRELYSPKNLNTEKIGTMMTSKGSMMVDSIRSMMTFSPLKRNFDSA